MTLESALEKAREYVEKQSELSSIELVLVEEITREEEFGWVFFYDSKKYIETDDIDFAVGGNAPIIIEKESGVLHVTGTAYPVDKYVEAFRQTGTCEVD